MPRRKRTYLPGLPYHIVQRGNNREACFVEAENYRYYLELWKECIKRYGVKVHAYCLMTNHIHFLVSPEETDSLSRVMQVVGSRYGYYFNKSYKRSGTVWEGRHKSSLVQSDRYLLTCMRYIELNPVAAGMIKKPEEYRWSSFLVNAWAKASLISPHPEYMKLGGTEDERCHAYRELFRNQLPEHDVHLIERASEYCVPLGDDRFRDAIENQYGIVLGQAALGRPKKDEVDG